MGFKARNKRTFTVSAEGWCPGGETPKQTAAFLTNNYAHRAKTAEIKKALAEYALESWEDAEWSGNGKTPKRRRITLIVEDIE